MSRAAHPSRSSTAGKSVRQLLLYTKNSRWHPSCWGLWGSSHNKTRYMLGWPNYPLHRTNSLSHTRRKSTKTHQKMLKSLFGSPSRPLFGVCLWCVWFGWASSTAAAETPNSLRRTSKCLSRAERPCSQGSARSDLNPICRYNPLIRGLALARKPVAKTKHWSLVVRMGPRNTSKLSSISLALWGYSSWLYIFISRRGTCHPYHSKMRVFVWAQRRYWKNEQSGFQTRKMLLKYPSQRRRICLIWMYFSAKDHLLMFYRALSTCHREKTLTFQPLPVALKT